MHVHVARTVRERMRSDLIDNYPCMLTCNRHWSTNSIATFSMHTQERVALQLVTCAKKRQLISLPATPTIATCISVSFTLKFIASRLALIGCCDGGMVMV